MNKLMRRTDIEQHLGVGRRVAEKVIALCPTRVRLPGCRATYVYREDVDRVVREGES